MRIWLPCIDAIGGVRSFTETLAAGLRDWGHEVDLSFFPIRWQLAPRCLRRVRPARGVDVVLADSWIAHAFVDIAPVLIACEHHNVHSFAYKRFRTWPRRLAHETWLSLYEARGFKAAKAVVAVSAYAAETIQSRFQGILPVVIHNPVDTGFFSPQAAPQQNVETDEVRLFFAGDLIRRKGADLLEPILSALGPRYRLRYTAGNRRDVALPRLPNMEALASLSREEMRDEYRAADICLLPSRYETFGIALAEALACGTPVVASRVAGIPEVVIDGETGYLCPPDDISEFAAAIRALASCPERRRRMGARGREDVVRRFDTKQIVGAYNTVIQDATAYR